MKQYIYISRREACPNLCCAMCGASLFPGEVYYDLETCTLCALCTQVAVLRYLRPRRRQMPVEVEV